MTDFVSPYVAAAAARAGILDHEWIEVADRRWCLCCDVFQARPNASAQWRPAVGACMKNTAYAHSKDSAHGER